MFQRAEATGVFSDSLKKGVNQTVAKRALRGSSPSALRLSPHQPQVQMDSALDAGTVLSCHRCFFIGKPKRSTLGDFVLHSVNELGKWFGKLPQQIGAKRP